MLHTTRKNRHFTKFFRSGVDSYSSGVDPYLMAVFRGECDFIRDGSRGRVQGVWGGAPPPPPEMTCGFLIQLVFCKKKKKTMWFIGLEVEQETSAPPPKKNPRSTPVY